MPARIEPGRAAPSRLGSVCARWLRLGVLALAASSLPVGCFLNPKTDDLPGTTVSIPDIGDGPAQPGADNGGNIGGGELAPTDPAPPPNLGEPSTPTEAAADAGSEASDTFATDAGSELPGSPSRDSGLDAE